MMYIISNIEEVLAKGLKKDHPDWTSEQIDAEINRMGDDFVYRDKVVEAGLFDGLFNSKTKLIDQILKTIEGGSTGTNLDRCYKNKFCGRDCAGCSLAKITKKLEKYDLGTLRAMKEALLAPEKTQEQSSLIETLSGEISDYL